MITRFSAIALLVLAGLLFPSVGSAKQHTLWGSVTVTVPTTATLRAVNNNTYRISSKAGQADVLISRSALKTPLATYRKQVTDGIVKSGGRVFSSSIKGNTLNISYRQKAPNSKAFNRFQTRVTKRANDYIIVMMSSRENRWGSSARKGLVSVFNSVSVKSQDPRDDRLGTWTVVTIRKVGQQQTKFTGQVRVWRLTNGTVRSTGTGTVPNVGTLRSESYSYKDGTSESYSYVNGELYEYGEGTWRTEGNRTFFSDTYVSLDGVSTATGFARQISRNQWVSFATINGTIQQTTTYTRVGK